MPDGAEPHWVASSPSVSQALLMLLKQEQQGQGERRAGRTSAIRSEVVELQVGREGHVLPRQAHVVEFQVVGVTTGRTEASVRAGTSSPGSGPHLPPGPNHPSTQPQGELPRDQRWAPGGA